MITKEELQEKLQDLACKITKLDQISTSYTAIEFYESKLDDIRKLEHVLSIQICKTTMDNDPIVIKNLSNDTVKDLKDLLARELTCKISTTMQEIESLSNE